MVDLEAIESRGSYNEYSSFVAFTMDVYGESIFKTVPITGPISF